MRGLATLAIAAGMSLTATALVPAGAQSTGGEHSEASLPQQSWSFSGFPGFFTGTYDRAALQRGFQVYNQVCSNCHSMKEMYYRNLSAIGLSDEQVKAIAATKTMAAVDDSGQPAERPALPSDHFKSPFPNDQAARAANGGALPPDQSLIVAAREDGSNYVYDLLNGYEDAPAGTTVQPGQYYNKWFPGHLLAMPPPLAEGAVEYADGTKATVPQMAADVTQFLTWTSHPDLEARKRMGVKAVLFLALMTGLTYAIKKKLWKDVH